MAGRYMPEDVDFLLEMTQGRPTLTGSRPVELMRYRRRPYAIQVTATWIEVFPVA